jgi:GNAT superfamily N-acetyltransferase
VTIRRASRDDAALLAEHRAAVWNEVGEWDFRDLAPQIPVWTAFFRERLAEGTYVAFVAEDDGTPIGSGAVLVHLMIPRPDFESDRAGRVQSVYVVPGARRSGIARAIMAHLLEYARAARLIALSLHPSDEARGLYAALGFEAADEMVLRFT